MKIFFIAVVAIIFFAGCKEKRESANNAAKDSSNYAAIDDAEMLLTEHPGELKRKSDRLWFAASGTGLKVTIATPEIRKQFPSVVEFVDSDARQNQQLIFAATYAVRDFKFTAIQLDNQLGIIEHAVIYQSAELSPKRAFVVNWNEVGDAPHRGITFIDSENRKRYFAIHANNADPEEGGYAPVLLSERKIASNNDAEANEVAVHYENCSGEIKLLKSISYSTRDFGPGQSFEFEYDDNNRIVKIIADYSGESSIKETFAFTYNGNNLAKITQNSNDKDWRKKISVEGNTIFISENYGYGWSIPDTLTVNKDGFIDNWTRISNNEIVQIALQYKLGNLAKQTAVIANSKTPSKRDKHTYEYAYDKKKSPFFDCKTPKWFLQWYFSKDYISQGHKYIDNPGFGINNITEVRYSSPSKDITITRSSHKYGSDEFSDKYTSTILRDGNDIGETYTTLQYHCK